MFKKLDVLWGWLVRVLTNPWPDSAGFMRVRGRLYALAAESVGKNFQVASDVRIARLRHLVVGNDVYIGPNCVLLINERTTIEDEVMLAHKIMLTTSNHGKENGSYRFGKGKSAPITLKRGCWIGAHCVVLPGVVVGQGTAVGANSVVNRSLPEHCVAAGAPAVVKVRDADRRQEKDGE